MSTSETSLTILPIRFPYSPDYGLPDCIRTSAVLLAIKYGNRRAAKLMNVGESTVLKWRKDCGLNNKETSNA